MAVTREYQCVVDGLFLVKRPISAPVQENCPICLLPAKQIFTICPVMGVTGSGIPSDSKDSTGYEGWQRDAWKKAEDKCHVDNMGTEPVSGTKLAEQHTFGKG